GAGLVAIYEGTLNGDRIDGKGRTAWPNHLPQGKPPGTGDFLFYATIPQTVCAPGDTLQDPMEVGQTAVQFRQKKSAFDCYLMAAHDKNAQAEGLVALMYRDGIGVDADPALAFHWAHAGAEADDYNSELVLAQMYEKGIGIQPDADLAAQWREKASRNPV